MLFSFFLLINLIHPRISAGTSTTTVMMSSIVICRSYPGHWVYPSKQHRMFAVINPVANYQTGANSHKSILTIPCLATIPSDAWHPELDRSPSTQTGTPATRNHLDCLSHPRPPGCHSLDAEAGGRRYSSSRRGGCWIFRGIVYDYGVVGY